MQIRILIAKPGLDSHDIGAKAVATACKNAGMEVIYLGTRNTPEEIARAAIEEDVHFIGLSVLSGSHLSIAKGVIETLKQQKVKDITVVMGGTIPQDDIPALEEMGVAKVFPSNTPLEKIVSYFKDRDEENPNERKLFTDAGKLKPECEPFSFPQRVTSVFDKNMFKPEDVQGNYLEKIGFPGEYPFTRGIYPTMYTGKLWSFRQVSGYGDPAESNKRLKFKMQAGETGLSVVFDIPTHNCYDSDNPLAAGEVGKNGVPIDSLEDMQALFEGIPIEQVSVALINSFGSTPIIFSMFIALAKKRGIPLDKLPGTIQNDPLAFYLCAPKVCEYPPRAALRIVRDIYAYASKYLPRWNLANVAGYQIREAGATMIQEVAFCLAHAMTYIETALAAGMDIDDFAPRIALYLGAYSNFFEEIAKYRATRRMWAKIIKEKYGAKNPRSWIAKFHTQTGANTLTAKEPYNNIIRGTIQALAAVLGGTQSLNVSSYDEALGLPTEDAVTMSTRTQQVIAYETGIPATIDPVGGSYYIEALTDEIENQVMQEIKRIEELGKGNLVEGVILGIESGQFVKEIFKNAYKELCDIQDGKKVVIGVNKFTLSEERPIEIFKVDPELEKKLVQRVKEVRRKRDQSKVDQALSKLQAALEKDENMIPPMIEAVEALATVEDIGNILKDYLGRYQPPGIN